MDSDIDLPDDLDDLDDEFFGIGEISKNKTKKTADTKNISTSSADKKRVIFQANKSTVDYDDDDPLAGLLSDDEDDFLAKIKKATSKKETLVQKDPEIKEKPASPAKMRRKPAADIDFGADDILGGLGFDESTPKSKGAPPVKKDSPAKTRSLTDKSSFMSSLFGGDESEKKVEKPPAAEKEFVLGDKYKKKEDDTGGFKVTAPGGEQPRRRRAALDKNDYQPSFSLDEPAKQSPPKTNEGGRSTSRGLDWLGVGPSKDSPKRERPASSGKDWLGMEPTSDTPKRERPATSGLDWLGDSSPKRERSEVAKTPERKNKQLDWLDGGDSVATQQEPNQIKPSLDWMDLKSNLKGNDRPTTAPNNLPEKNVAVQSPRRQPQAQNTQSPRSIPNATTSSITSQQQEATNRAEGNLMDIDYQGIRLRHEEEIKSVENFYKNQIKTMEETQKEAETRLKNDLESRNEELKIRLSEAESEKQKLSLNFQEKIEKIEREHRQEVEKLKELHGKALLTLREDHEEALKRLQRLKEQEIEAVSSTQNQSKSLEMVMDELRSKTSLLSTLQEKLEGRHKETLDLRQEDLINKEKQLKILEEKLEKTRKDSEDERARLQELVLRLEKRLQEQSQTLEEERWQVIQEKGRLEATKKALNEDRSELEIRLEREKEKLHQAKELILQEQKGMLSTMSQERLLITNLETQLKRKEEELNRLNSRLTQDEKKLESEMRSIGNEYHLLNEQRDNLKAEAAKIKRERDSLSEEKDRLKRENEQLQELAMRVKKRSEEIEDMCLNAVQSREEGHNSLIAARKLESSCNEQRSKIMEQFQNLHIREQKLIEEKIAISSEIKRLEENKHSLICANCKLALIRPLLMNNYVEPRNHHLQRENQSSIEEPSLLIWKIRAQKDREFLENESQFLESLRRSS